MNRNLFGHIVFFCTTCIMFILLQCENSQDPNKNQPSDSLAYPTQVNIDTVYYSFSIMTIKWSKSTEENFKSYNIYFSTEEYGNKTHVISLLQVNDTIITTVDFNPGEDRWYWLSVENNTGGITFSEGYLVKDNPPETIELFPITHNNNNFNITWTAARDSDFYSYSLYQTLSIDSDIWTLVDSSNQVTDTSHTISSISQNEYRYYKIIVTDYWGLKSESPIRIASSYNNKILFHANRDLYIMNSDGSNPINLTNDPNHDNRYGIFSPDGSKIAYEGYSYTTVRTEIFIMDIDGTNKTQLTSSQPLVILSFPSFSPDGTKLVYAYNGNIYTMNTDGTNKLKITYLLRLDSSPQYSYNGDKIFFRSENDTSIHLWSMNTNGSNQTNLTPFSFIDFDEFPSFSCSNNKISFIKEIDAGFDLFTMDNDGGNKLNLTNNSAFYSYPRFSPDGSKIVFEHGGVSIINSDGTGLQNLTNGYHPEFSPDGEKIIFTSRPINDHVIYIMNIDGSDKFALTNFDFDAERPQFQP